MFPEYAALEALRLDQDWTYTQLAQAMRKCGLVLSHRTLNYLLTNEGAQSRVHARTRHKIRRFLELVTDHVPTITRRRKRRKKGRVE
jgi:hypothetical protein